MIILRLGQKQPKTHLIANRCEDCRTVADFEALLPDRISPTSLFGQSPNNTGPIEETSTPINPAFETARSTFLTHT